MGQAPKTQNPILPITQLVETLPVWYICNIGFLLNLKTQAQSWWLLQTLKKGCYGATENIIQPGWAILFMTSYVIFPFKESMEFPFEEFKHSQLEFEMVNLQLLFTPKGQSYSLLKCNGFDIRQLHYLQASLQSAWGAGCPNEQYISHLCQMNLPRRRASQRAHSYLHTQTPCIPSLP